MALTPSQIITSEGVNRFLPAYQSNMAQASTKKNKKSWQEIAREAQQYRDASIGRVKPGIPQLPKNLPKNVTQLPGKVLCHDEVEITEMLLEDLLCLLASGEVTAIAVTTAFLRRAGLAQKLVCLPWYLTPCCAKLR